MVRIVRILKKVLRYLELLIELCQSASFMDHPVLDSREDCRQGIQGLGRGVALSEDQQDGVIAGDGTHQGIRRMMVQDIGQCRSQTYLGTDKSYLPGKLDALDAGRESVAVTLSQGGRQRVSLALYLCDLQCFQIPGKGSLGGFDSPETYLLDKFTLTFDLLCPDDFNDGLLPGFYVLHN
jgi:hypothetical protein